MLGCHGKFRSLRAYRIEGKRARRLVYRRAAGAASLEPCLLDSSRRAGIRNPNRKRSSAAPSWGCYARSKKGHHPLCGNRDDSRLRLDWGMKTRSRDQGRTAGVGSVKRPSRGFGPMGETRR